MVECYLVKLQSEGCNFIKSNIPQRAFLKFFELYKWYQFTENIMGHV